jgi:hypothetical protein
MGGFRTAIATDEVSTPLNGVKDLAVETAVY